MSKTPRQQKTPRQRAQEALDVEERRVTKLTKKRNDLATQQAAVQAELAQAIARRDYLKQHPDLATTEAQRQAAATRHNRSSTSTGDNT